MRLLKHINMNKVFCYRNLNRKGVVWSVKDTKTGLVIDRSPVVYIKNAELKVSQAGRKRVLLQKRKNVHAGVKGIRIKSAPKTGWIRVEYNPYKYESFVSTENKTPVLNANYVMLNNEGCWIHE